MRTVPAVLALCGLPLVSGCALATGLPTVSVDSSVKLQSKVTETSGLAAAGGLLWTINDSGDKPRLYGLDPTSGKVERKVRLKGAINYDWEDLAHDDRYLYIADTGNNSGEREVLKIYRIAQDQLDQKGRQSADTIQLRYADYAAQFGGKKSHNVDCEAIARVDDQLWLFTKNRGDQKTRLYKAELTLNDVQVLEPRGEYPVKGLVTAVDFNPQTRELALLEYGYGAAFGQASIWRVPVAEGLPDWNRAQRHLIRESGQWEAILWDSDDGVILTAEGSFFGQARLARIKFKQAE